MKNRPVYIIIVAIRVILLYLIVKLLSVSGGPSSSAIYSTFDTLLKLFAAPISLSALGYGVVVLTKYNTLDQVLAKNRYLLSTASFTTCAPLLLSIFGALTWNLYATSERLSAFVSVYVNAIIFFIPSILVLSMRVNSLLQSEGKLTLLASCQALSTLCTLLLTYLLLNLSHVFFFLPLLPIALIPLLFIAFVYFFSKKAVLAIFTAWSLSLYSLLKAVNLFIRLPRKLSFSHVRYLKRKNSNVHILDGYKHSLSVLAASIFPFLSRSVIGIVWSPLNLGIFDAALSISVMPFALIYTIMSGPMMFRLSALAANQLSSFSSNCTHSKSTDKLFLAAEHYSIIILSICLLFYAFALFFPSLPVLTLYSSQYLSSIQIIPFACLSQMLIMRHIPHLFALLAISNPSKLFRYESKLYFVQITVFLLSVLAMKLINLPFGLIGYALVFGSACFYICNTISIPIKSYYYGSDLQSSWFQQRIPVSFYPELLIALFITMLFASYLKDALALHLSA